MWTAVGITTALTAIALVAVLIFRVRRVDRKYRAELDQWREGLARQRARKYERRRG